MKYVFIKDGMVHEIVPEENPIFPGVPFDKRYSKAFVAACIAVDDNTADGIGAGWRYENGAFAPPEEINETEESE